MASAFLTWVTTRSTGISSSPHGCRSMWSSIGSQGGGEIMAAWLSRGVPSAGIYAGPAAWLIDTQFNYAAVPWVCAHQVPLIPVFALAMVGVSLFGGFLSWRGYATAAPTPLPDSSGGGRPHRFMALVGIAVALLFTAVILIHGAAGLVFN